MKVHFKLSKDELNNRAYDYLNKVKLKKIYITNTLQNYLEARDKGW